MSSPEQSSTHTLLRKLTRNRTYLAYAAVLDPTGEFRQYDRDIDPSAHLSDVISELHLAGRSDDAVVLEEALADGLGDHPALLVTLLCARGVQRKTTHNRLFRKPTELPLEKELGAFWKGSRGRPALFCEPLGYDEIGVGREGEQMSPSAFPVVSAFSDGNGVAESHLRNGGDEGGNAELVPDWIASAARFAEEQDAFWRTSKVILEMDEASEVTDLRERFREQDNFLAWVQSRNARKTLLICNVSPSKESADLSGVGVMQDRALLDNVIARCLMGSEVDMRPLEWYEDSPPSRLAATMLGNGYVVSKERRAALGKRAACVATRVVAQQRLAVQVTRTNEIADLTTKASLYGSVYQDVLSFAEAYAPLSKGRVLCAVTNFAFDLSRDYARALFAASQRSYSLERNKAWAVLDAAEEYLADLVIVAEILVDAEGTDGSACDVLNKILEAATRYVGNEVVEKLLDRAMHPYLQSVWEWVVDGSSNKDVYDEFFCTRLGLSVTGSEMLQQSSECDADLHLRRTVGLFPDVFTLDQAVFILRAGRSRALLKSLAPERCGRIGKPEGVDFSNSFTDSTHPSSMADGLPLKSEGEPRTATYSLIPCSKESDICSKNEDKTSSRHTISRPREEGSASCAHFEGPELPTFWSIEVPDSCFRFPRYSASLSMESAQNRGKVFLEDPELFAMKHKNKVRAAKISHRLRPPPKLLYDDVLLRSLRKIDAGVQEEVLDYFKNDLDIFTHLRNLRAHVLLGAGDFADVLIEQIDAAASLSDETERYIQMRASAAMTFYGSSGPGTRSIRDRTHLNRCLLTALNLSSFDSNPHVTCLSLDAIPGDGDAKSSLWDCSMEFKYEVPYPVNMMLADNVLQIYSKLFDFFLRVLRARKSLRNLFLFSRRNSSLTRNTFERVLTNREVRVKLWQFCWQAESFVSIFGGFEMDQVLGSSWEAFESSWQTVKSVWELRDSHSRYLKDCIRKCLLSDKHKSVLGVMTGGFEIVVKVDKELSAICVARSNGFPASSGDINDLLVSSIASLRRRCAFLTDVLERLLEGGTYSHLEDLLTRLKFAQHYEQGSK